MTQQAADTLRGMADRLDRQSQILIERYGQGVRPSWVSEELAINGMYAQKYRTEADQIEMKLRKGFDEYGNYGENNPPVGESDDA